MHGSLPLFCNCLHRNALRRIRLRAYLGTTTSTYDSGATKFISHPVCTSSNVWHCSPIEHCERIDQTRRCSSQLLVGTRLCSTEAVCDVICCVVLQRNGPGHYSLQPVILRTSKEVVYMQNKTRNVAIANALQLEAARRRAVPIRFNSSPMSSLRSLSLSVAVLERF